MDRAKARRAKRDFTRMLNGDVLTFRAGVFAEECEVAIKALNKMIPQPVLCDITDLPPFRHVTCMCPTCGTVVDRTVYDGYDENAHYCVQCGQHFDWRKLKEDYNDDL